MSVLKSFIIDVSDIMQLATFMQRNATCKVCFTYLLFCALRIIFPMHTDMS